MNHFKQLWAEDSEAQFECLECGEQFYTDACGEQNLAYCDVDRRLKPHCPSCGTTEAQMII